MLKFVKSHGLEGVVAKRSDSVYQPGLRTGLWTKHRINLGQEFVFSCVILNRIRLLFIRLIPATGLQRSKVNTMPRALSTASVAFIVCVVFSARPATILAQTRPHSTGTQRQSEGTARTEDRRTALRRRGAPKCPEDFARERTAACESRHLRGLHLGVGSGSSIFVRAVPSDWRWVPVEVLVSFGQGWWQAVPKKPRRL